MKSLSTLTAVTVLPGKPAARSKAAAPGAEALKRIRDLLGGYSSEFEHVSYSSVPFPQGPEKRPEQPNPAPEPAPERTGTETSRPETPHEAPGQQNRPASELHNPQEPKPAEENEPSGEKASQTGVKAANLACEATNIMDFLVEAMLALSSNAVMNPLSADALEGLAAIFMHLRELCQEMAETA